MTKYQAYKKTWKDSNLVGKLVIFLVFVFTPVVMLLFSISGLYFIFNYPYWTFGTKIPFMVCLAGVIGIGSFVYLGGFKKDSN